MRLLAAIAVASVLVAQGPGSTPPLSAVCADAEITEFGLDCSADEPCPIYLELTYIDHTGDRYYVTGNFHTDSATIWSLLLQSNDDGKTWSEAAARIRGTSLDQIQFADFENGWASGQVVGSLPKDPFLLKTSDGGKAWRRIPLFEDMTYGSIEQFWFDSRAHGLLLLSRRGEKAGKYQKLETTTGGESWVMREASPRPISLGRAKGATSSNADLRIRTDKASKSFRIERRKDAQWMLVASYPIQAGTCQPAPRKSPENPPQP